ncbi:FIST C-terminal domain-containing protein [Curvibacter sp. HBC61]|uniref:FIST C-terminal domain-containing protein n=1 Tax=Curvibacter cyanobacteriorum TaxID=3026422 RepID=A0ABT5N7D3_9BURK|nr:FIST N-terminal domain-containing protein [Curvibacter sp. HBC61]MDD0841042.1 FIST C-terminal domain-containing protein [Curvibacter sp. HBC61]
MSLFPSGHATHPQWRMAASLVLAQLRAQMALPEYAHSPSLGLLYITDHYAPEAQDLLDFLSAELPEVTDWAGTVGVGVAANNAEYFDEPALSVLLCELPAHHYRVFSGVAPLGLGFEPHTALVHADASTPDVAELIAEMAERTATGYLFGGLAASRQGTVQFAVGGDGNMRGQGAARGVFSGGLSGVAFSEDVSLISRVTQGCLPVSKVHEITAVDGHVLLELDGEPALTVLLRDLRVSLDLNGPQRSPALQQALEVVRSTLVGLSAPGDDSINRSGHFGADVLVRHIIGLDPARQGVAVAHPLSVGMQMAFCQRHVQAARADLMRICAEIREELEPEMWPADLATTVAGDALGAAPHPARRIAGAVYVSCSGRGGPHFGGPSAELQIVRHALGDVPLVGFFAGGEIARHHLYGYTGVLTVFTTPA